MFDVEKTAFQQFFPAGSEQYPLQQMIRFVTQGAGMDFGVGVIAGKGIRCQENQ